MMGANRRPSLDISLVKVDVLLGHACSSAFMSKNLVFVSRPEGARVSQASPGCARHMDCCICSLAVASLPSK